MQHDERVELIQQQASYCCMSFLRNDIESLERYANGMSKILAHAISQLKTEAAIAKMAVSKAEQLEEDFIRKEDHPA